MTSFIEKKMEIKLEELYPVDISCGKYITYVLCKNDDRLFMVGIFSNEFSSISEITFLDDDDYNGHYNLVNFKKRIFIKQKIDFDLVNGPMAYHLTRSDHYCFKEEDFLTVTDKIRVGKECKINEEFLVLLKMLETEKN